MFPYPIFHLSKKNTFFIIVFNVEIAMGRQTHHSLILVRFTHTET